MQGPPPLDEKVGKMGKATLMGVVLQKIELGPPASARLLPSSCRHMILNVNSSTGRHAQNGSFLAGLDALY